MSEQGEQSKQSGGRRITVNPITRLEGHAKVEIFLDDDGNVKDAYLQAPELRGFEKFCEGRYGEEMPIITSRICGVCPEAHHLASTKALDDAFNVEPPETARKLRELLYNAYYVYDHLVHFYFLGGPDFIVGPDSSTEERNILGVIKKAGEDVGRDVIKHRSYAHKVIEMIGGRAINPVCGLPGGISKPISEEERKEIEEIAQSCVDFSKYTVDLFNKVVLDNEEYFDLIKNDSYSLQTYYMGLVDEKNKVNFYDGKIRVIDPEGSEFSKFDGKEYLDQVEEHVEPWTYVKLPYLKNVGWQGLGEGAGSGIYRVGPLARVNVSEGFTTPLAQAEYQKFQETLGKPAHSTLAYHWARVMEMLHAAERMVELSRDKDITGDKIRNKLGEPGEGVGVIEAARGTLIHHYKLDGNGIVNKANLIVATTNNSGAICLSVKKAAQAMINNGNVDQGLLNKIEMAFRAYDPCMACATHTLPGKMPLEATIYDSEGNVYHKLNR